MGGGPSEAATRPAGKLPRRRVPVNPKLYIFFRTRYLFLMIASAQIRAARGLLKWTQATLAHRAAISAVTLNMIESGTVDPRTSTLRAIESALEAAGIEFIGSETDGLGVRFRPAARD